MNKEEYDQVLAEKFAEIAKLSGQLERATIELKRSQQMIAQAIYFLNLDMPGTALSILKGEVI